MEENINARNEEQEVEIEPIEKEPIVEKADTFSCPACGGKMIFNIKEQALTCEYCDNKVEIDADSKPIREYYFDLAGKQASKNWGKEVRAIRCESCGAEIVLDNNTTAKFCSFCGSPSIVKELDSDSISPESLIPFKISKQKATENFKRWIKKKFFAPSELKKKEFEDNFSGMYLPFWTYDSNTDSSYSALKGTYYYVTSTRVVDGKVQTYQERKIRWRHVTGKYFEFFDDVLVNASKNHDRNIIKVLEPFNLKELIPYKTEYLSGFIAERYSINLKDGWKYAEKDIDEGIRRGVIRQIGGDEVEIKSLNTSYNNIKYKHILLPIWISSYKYKDKIYRFMVNAQTGEVQGKHPLSPLKILLTILSGLGIIGIIALYIYLH